MSGHTPTPWKVFTTPDGRKLVGIGDTEGQGICDCGFGVWSWMHEDGIANANLIVEAVNSHEIFRNALISIACFNDAGAEASLSATGSYSSFDEPGSVQIAREALLHASAGRGTSNGTIPGAQS